MPVNNIQSVIMLLLFFTKIYIQTKSVSVYDKRRYLKIYTQEEKYSISFVKSHRFCIICTQLDDNSKNLENFQQNEEQKIRNLRDHLRSARNLEVSSYEFIYRRPRSPYMESVKNFIKTIDSQIQNYFFGTQTQPRRNVEWIANSNKIYQATKLIVPHTAKVKSTPSPGIRQIRSTQITNENPTKPPPQSSVTTNTPFISTVTLPPDTVLNSFIPFTASKPNIDSKMLSSNTKVSSAKSRSSSPTSRSASKHSTNDWSAYEIPLIQQKFVQALDEFERKYYTATSSKLFSISPPDRRENGISFVESGIFLFLILNALSTDVDKETKSEIVTCLSLYVSDTDKIKMIHHILENLPPSSETLKFRWSMRLVVNNSWHLTNSGAEKALPLQLDRLTGNETTEQLLQILNNMVERDSGGAMRDTFEEDELSEGARAVLIQTMYVRARWRAAPTLLNGTRPFCNADTPTPRNTRMLRVNDMMRYADLTEWDAQAVEISYATPGLSLLVLVPRGQSLRSLSARAATTSLNAIVARMKPLRVAVTLPIYTLRMTLLLPNKLQAMGISRLVAPNNETSARDLRLSHAVQRLMFWAEAGRNAFKDDGFEWDHKPDLEMMVDRPYLFYVRWENLTLMNGNFVL